VPRRQSCRRWLYFREPDGSIDTNVDAAHLEVRAT
jgi:hypothetical protein